MKKILISSWKYLYFMLLFQCYLNITKKKNVLSLMDQNGVTVTINSLYIILK